MHSNKIITKINTFLFEFDTSKIHLYTNIISLFCIINVVLLLPDFMNIYGENSYISPITNSKFIEDFNPTFYWITNLTSVLSISNSITVLIILSLYFLSLLLVFIGIQRMMFSLIALFIHIMMINTSFFFSYGADYFITFSLFICLLMSVPSKYVQSFGIRFLQVHLCIVYFFAGFGKTLGTDWWDGNAIWYVFNIFVTKTPVSIIPALRFFFIIISIFTVFIELCYPLLVYKKGARKFAIISIVGLHIGISLFMNLYTFGAIMIILNFVAWERYLQTDIIKLKKHVIKTNKLKLQN